MKVVSEFAWRMGAANIAISMGMAAYAQHSKKLQVNEKATIEKAEKMQMINGVGLCLSSFRKSRLVFIPVVLLVTGCGLFSGIIYYSRIQGDYNFNRFIPAGGMCSISGWALLVLC